MCVCVRAGDLFILVYGVDSRESFDEVRRLLTEIYEAKGQHSGVSAAPAVRPGAAGDPPSGGGGNLIGRKPKTDDCVGTSSAGELLTFRTLCPVFGELRHRSGPLMDFGYPSRVGPGSDSVLDWGTRIEGDPPSGIQQCSTTVYFRAKITIEH